MTPEEQRIAIAKASGFQPDNAYHDWNLKVIPDYYRDLNAIREAEEALEPEQQKLYILFLCEGIVNPTNPMDLFYLKHKSAAECSRALLRTLGLWKD